jgi:hypothetical protein
MAQFPDLLYAGKITGADQPLMLISMFLHFVTGQPGWALPLALRLALSLL